MGITEILRRIWLFPANKIKSSESGRKQPTQLIIAVQNCHTGLKLIKYILSSWLLSILEGPSKNVVDKPSFVVVIFCLK